MPGERTLLKIFVGESDAPIQSTNAYLSNNIFKMLYAKADLPPMFRMYLRLVIFRVMGMQQRSDTSLNTTIRFWLFLPLFFFSVSIGIAK